MKTVLAMALLAAAALAQAPLQASGKLLAVRVSGSARFAQPELVAATGLQPGAPVSDSLLKEAADRLAATGMFTEVGYTFVVNPSGTTVEYKVNDVMSLLPAQFDNIVWLSDSELLAELKKRVPLFTGQVPNNGDMYNQIAAAIQAILQQRGVSAAVHGFPVTPQTGGTILGFTFSAEGVKIPIRSVEFPGASPEMKEILQKSNAELLSGDYSFSRAEAFDRLNVLPQYRSRGYLKAATQAPAAQLVDPATNAVTVSLPVVEGPQYRLAGLEWKGNAALPSSELAKAVKLHPGDVLNQVQLDGDLDAISKVYANHGYLDARLQPEFVLDDAARTALAQVDINEGTQYSMGAVNFEGVSPDTATRLAKMWKIKSSQPFDGGYALEFMKDLYRAFDFRAINLKESLNKHPENHTVDVTFTFAKMASSN